MMNIKTQVGGFFRLVATKPDGTQRVVADWFPNLITDIGLDRIGTTNVCCNNALVGTGSTPPTAADTKLSDQVAFATILTSTQYGTSSSAPYFGWFRYTWRFAAGAAAGTLNEIGIGWGSTDGKLFSRSLIKDALGDPMGVVVLPDEVLDVTYELRLYAPVDDVTFNVGISGTTHSCVLRPMLVTQVGKWAPGNQFGIGWAMSYRLASGDIGSVTGSPSGGSTSPVVLTVKTYVPGSHKLGVKISTGLGSGNFVGGIKSITLESGLAGSYQCSFDPVIPKDANKIFSIDAEFSWARYTP